MRAFPVLQLETVLTTTCAVNTTYFGWLYLRENKIERKEPVCPALGACGGGNYKLLERVLMPGVLQEPRTHTNALGSAIPTISSAHANLLYWPSAIMNVP